MRCVLTAVALFVAGCATQPGTVEPSSSSDLVALGFTAPREQIRLDFFERVDDETQTTFWGSFEDLDGAYGIYYTVGHPTGLQLSELRNSGGRWIYDYDLDGVADRVEIERDGSEVINPTPEEFADGQAAYRILSRKFLAAFGRN